MTGPLIRSRCAPGAGGHSQARCPPAGSSPRKAAVALGCPFANKTTDRVPLLLQAGIRPSLSVDTEASAAGDMFNVMRAFISSHGLGTTYEPDTYAELPLQPTVSRVEPPGSTIHVV